MSSSAVRLGSVSTAYAPPARPSWVRCGVPTPCVKNGKLQATPTLEAGVTRQPLWHRVPKGCLPLGTSVDSQHSCTTQRLVAVPLCLSGKQTRSLLD